MLFMSSGLFANNLQISNMRIRGQNDAQGYKMIKLDVSWDNSWRTSTYESNHDAVWIFAKYRLLWEDDVWRHATINATGNTIPAGSALDIPADGKGAFIYRNADGSGSVNYENLELRWNYASDGLNNTDSVELCVFGIEMVYVPQGSFHLGDGNSNSVGRFVQGTTTDMPFEITSEGAITIGNSSTSQLWGTTAATIGDPGVLPADYPKGFQAFYVMKYEITQGQYRDFLNKLTRDQQDQRGMNITGLGNYVNNNSGPMSRNGIRLAIDPGTPLPRGYDCDLNSNAIGNEGDDGEHIACNYLSYYDVAAYLDWSALRPMTELEYEKASRGTLPSFPNERAWGNTKLVRATGIMNGGTANETPTSPTLTNVNMGSATGVQGPLRVGSFAGATTTREQAGASYYGIMELSGNCTEWVIDAGRAAARNYTGEHGDGELATNGNQNQTNWYNRGGLRGGAWNTALTSENPLNVSDRSSVNGDYSTQRYVSSGGRGVRTAP